MQEELTAEEIKIVREEVNRLEMTPEYKVVRMVCTACGRVKLHHLLFPEECPEMVKRLKARFDSEENTQ
jgi:hypothetical protein